MSALIVGLDKKNTYATIINKEGDIIKKCKKMI